MAVDTRPARTPVQREPTRAGPTPRWRSKETLAAWLFILPSLIGFLSFTAGSVLAAGVISLLNWNLFSSPTFAGLKNFARLGPDPTFWSALGSTAYFTFVSVPLTIGVLGWFGISGPAWLIGDNWAMPALIAMSVWKSFGFGMVVFLAGLQAIPQQLYEAARVDGSSAWQTFRSVTLPTLSPSLFFVIVTRSSARSRSSIRP